MLTRFKIKKADKGEDLEAPAVVPDCDMVPLKKGDYITLKRISQPVVYPETTSNLEEWRMRVVDVSLEIVYYQDEKDRMNFYDPKTVSGRQVVTVEFYDHRWV